MLASWEAPDILIEPLQEEAPQRVWWGQIAPTKRALLQNNFLVEWCGQEVPAQAQVVQLHRDNFKRRRVVVKIGNDDGTWCLMRPKPGLHAEPHWVNSSDQLRDIVVDAVKRGHLHRVFFWPKTPCGETTALWNVWSVALGLNGKGAWIKERVPGSQKEEAVFEFSLALPAGVALSALSSSQTYDLLRAACDDAESDVAFAYYYGHLKKQERHALIFDLPSTDAITSARAELEHLMRLVLLCHADKWKGNRKIEWQLGWQFYVYPPFPDSLLNLWTNLLRERGPLRINYELARAHRCMKTDINELRKWGEVTVESTAHEQMEAGFELNRWLEQHAPDAPRDQLL